MITLAQLNEIPGRPEFMEPWLQPAGFAVFLLRDTNMQTVFRVHGSKLEIFSLARQFTATERLDFANYARAVELMIESLYRLDGSEGS